MKVLFQSRINLFDSPGGDTIQIVKTKEYLEKIGVKVDISLKLEPDLLNYDIVHLFNLIRPQEVYLQACNAKKYDKKVILSTIYGFHTEYEQTSRRGFSGWLARRLNERQIEYCKVAARVVKNFEIHRGVLTVLGRGYHRTQREIIRMIDMVLPNSESEMKRLIRDFNLRSGFPYAVVPNAADKSIFDPKKVTMNNNLKTYEGCILCIARIEGPKNQLNLIRAVKELPYYLVLIGNPGTNYLKYYERARKEAGENVYFLGFIDHSLLPQFYKIAKVHALVSWFETPGLSSIEAGLMGCNLVLTEKGDTQEYFDDYVYYCNPDSVESIRNALIRAYNEPVNPALRKHILQHFTWEKTAEKTLRAYEEIMSG